MKITPILYATFVGVCAHAYQSLPSSRISDSISVVVICVVTAFLGAAAFVSLYLDGEDSALLRFVRAVVVPGIALTYLAVPLSESLPSDMAEFFLAILALVLPAATVGGWLFLRTVGLVRRFAHWVRHGTTPAD